MSDTTDGVTEFIELDPNEMHLVPAGANGFPFLLAKSVGDTVEEVQKESRSRSKKGRKMGKKKELRKALERSEAALRMAGVEHTVGTKAPMSASTALSLLKSAADDAAARGDTAMAHGLRQEIAVFKLQVAEREHQARPRPSRLGPNSRELFTRTGTLGEDVQIGGL